MTLTAAYDPERSEQYSKVMYNSMVNSGLWNNHELAKLEPNCKYQHLTFSYPCSYDQLTTAWYVHFDSQPKLKWW